MKKSVSLEKVILTGQAAGETNISLHKSKDCSNLPKRRFKSTYEKVLEDYSIIIKHKAQRCSSLSDITNASEFSLDLLKYTKHKTRHKEDFPFFDQSSGDAIWKNLYFDDLTQPYMSRWDTKGKKSRRKQMSQPYATKFTRDYLDIQNSNEANYSSGVENSSVCSTDAMHGQKASAFPFTSTPSGNLKVQSNQVVFQSPTVGVLLADPTQAKVKIKFEGNAAGEPKDVVSRSSMPFESMELHPSIYQARNSRICERNNKQKSPGMREDKGKDLNTLGYATAEPIDWAKVQLPKKQDMFQEFYRRIHNYINTDTIVRIGDEEFHCHLMVLQMYSTFFDQNPVREIELPISSVTPEAFHLVYEWMIGGQESSKVLKRENVLNLFCAAQYMAIKDLEEQCWAVIVNESLFIEDTAFFLFREARSKEMTPVMDIMIPRINRFFLPLVASTDFLNLEPEEIIILLQSNHISVTSEVEVLMAAVRWLYGDWNNRRGYAMELMKCVRFGHISPWQLVDIKRNPDNAEILEIVNEPDVQQMVDDGLAYVIIKYWYGNNSKNYNHWLDVLGLAEPAERNWIGEEMNHVTYKDFLKYLEKFMVPKEQMYQQMAMMQTTRRNDDIPGSMRGGMDNDKMEMRRPKMDFPLPATLKGLAGDKGKFPTMSEFVENRRKAQEARCPLPNRAPLRIDDSSVPPELSERRSPDCVMHQKHLEEQKRQLQDKQQMPQTSHGIQHVHMCSVQHESTSTKHEMRDPPVKDSDEVNTTSDSSETAATSATEKNYSTKGNEKRHSVAASYLAAHTANLRSAARRASPSQPASCPHTKSSRVDDSLRQTNAANDGFSPQISLFNHSKESLARINMNKLSTSILGPSNKNYTVDGSLFHWERETVLVFGGIDPHTPYGVARNTGKDIYRFDPMTNVWDCVGELPEPRHHHSVAFLRGRVYLVGGADPRDDDLRGKSVVVSTVWSFEPVTRSWYSECGLAGPRKNFGLVVHKMALYAIGGQDKKGRVLHSVERFDPKTASWAAVRSMRVARMAVACTKYRDYIWVAGGMTGDKKRPVCNTVECYDSKTDEWTTIHNLRFPRCFATLFSMNDKLYIVGGAGKIADKDKTASSVGAIDVWQWRARAWQPAAALAMPRHGHALAYLGTQLIIIGGVTTIYMRALNNVESYCCERGAWIRGVGALPAPLSGHGAVTLPPASLM